MSTTYSLCCDKCKVRLWAGQSSCGNQSLYEMEPIQRFLFDHVGHPLRFTVDGADEATDSYKEE